MINEKFKWEVKAGKFVHVSYTGSGKPVKTKYKKGDIFVAPDYEVPPAFRDIVKKGDRVFSPEELKDIEEPILPPDFVKDLEKDTATNDTEEKKAISDIDENIPSLEPEKKKEDVTEKKTPGRKPKAKE